MSTAGRAWRSWGPDRRLLARVSNWRVYQYQLAVKDSRCTRSAILNLTVSETWIPVFKRKNTSAGMIVFCYVCKFLGYHLAKF